MKTKILLFVVSMLTVVSCSVGDSDDTEQLQDNFVANAGFPFAGVCYGTWSLNGDGNEKQDKLLDASGQELWNELVTAVSVNDSLIYIDTMPCVIFMMSAVPELADVKSLSYEGSRYAVSYSLMGYSSSSKLYALAPSDYQFTGYVKGESHQFRVVFSHSLSKQSQMLYDEYEHTVSMMLYVEGIYMDDVLKTVHFGLSLKIRL